MGLLAALGVALTAGPWGCAPALDWREIRPEGASVLLLFPCRPSRHERALTLSGQAVRLTMHSCEADGTLWALAWADVGDPRQVAPALNALQHALVQNLGAQTSAAKPYQPAGATPQAASVLTTLDGRTPDGRSVWAESAVFAWATRVYQLTTLGPQPAPASGTFFDSVKVMP